MDSEILKDIIYDMRVREIKGKEAYNCTMDRTDLSELQWLNHAYEEALDLAIYLKKIIKNKHNENA